MERRWAEKMKLQEAVTRACQEPCLVDALTWIAVWECERAISQAREFDRTGVRTGSNDGAWDTCFRICFTAVMAAWTGQKSKVVD